MMMVMVVVVVVLEDTNVERRLESAADAYNQGE